MGIYSSGSIAVDAMGRIRITGNIIPPRWYREILRDNGRPDHLAVTLLSDIVYWYRPVEVRDEITGQVIGLRRKFKGDLLQKTYEQYSRKFLGAEINQEYYALSLKRLNEVNQSEYMQT